METVHFLIDKKFNLTNRQVSNIVYNWYRCVPFVFSTKNGEEIDDLLNFDFKDKENLISKFDLDYNFVLQTVLNWYNNIRLNKTIVFTENDIITNRSNVELNEFLIFVMNGNLICPDFLNYNLN
jgi:hypothetical protein